MACDVSQEHLGPAEGTSMISLAMGFAATGLVALSFECVGAAWVFFGVCGLLLKLA